MDISRVRKKIKETKAKDEQKTREVPQEEQSEKLPQSGHQDSVIKKAPEIVQAEVGTEQKEQGEIKKTEEPGKDESPDVGKEAEAVRVDETEILTFKVANEEYAVKIAEIQEVLRNQRITAVPRAPKYLKGVTSIRGKIVPIIDLRMRLGLTESNVGKEKIIVLSGKEPLGALVGVVIGVYRFPSHELLLPPSTLTDNEKSFIEGVVKIDSKFISILKVDEILKLEVL